MPVPTSTSAATPTDDDRWSPTAVPWERLVAQVERFREGIRDLPVVHASSARELRGELESRYRFDGPTDLGTLVDEVAVLLRDHAVHVTHPRYFGLFNPSVRPAGVMAETLAAAFNPQLAVWSHAPAAQELERLALRRLARLIGFDVDRMSASFTTGGAEANLSALLAALAHRAPEWSERGVAALPAAPMVYLSADGHDSFVKAARIAGLGTDCLRRVPVNGSHAMDVRALQAMVAADVAAGHMPLMLVATAGTTSTGAVDPIPELDACARASGMWLHVDAAWGGSALLSPRLAPALHGIAAADSVTWDAHKWMSVPMGAGMFYCRHPGAVQRAFAVTTAYMPPAEEDPTAATVDPFVASVQWSRRAAGLKVFLALAELGVEGYAALIERQAACADLLRDRLTAAGWEVVNDTPLPVVCFTHPALAVGRGALDDLLASVYARGSVWISAVRLASGDHALRACITSYLTSSEDIDVLVRELALALPRGRGNAG